MGRRCRVIGQYLALLIGVRHVDRGGLKVTGYPKYCPPARPAKLPYNNQLRPNRYMH